MGRSDPDDRRYGSSLRSLARIGTVLGACWGLPPTLAGQGGAKVSPQEYEGWRQYSVHCARCHGQDVLGNPVAANLLESVAPGGSAADEATFAKVVREGRPSRGMPGLKGVVTEEQTLAIYAYVKGRAEKKIPPGRPRATK